MRFARVLIKKCFRDIWRNIKQFISIIFIVAISCTLYIGLEANAQGFENRVNQVFEKGNLSDLWVTINPNFENTSKMDDDLKFIEATAGENSKIEKRLFIPSSILNYSVNALISDSFPTVNKPCAASTINYNDNNFFFVDKTIITKYENLTNKNFILGDSLPVSFQSGIFKGLATTVIQNDQTIKSILDTIIFNINLSSTIKDSLIKILHDNIDTIQSELEKILNTYFKNDLVTFNIKVNGIMEHPENVENGEFSTSNYLISSRLVLNSFINDFAKEFNALNLAKLFQNIKNQYPDNVLTNTVCDIILKLLEDPKNQAAIDLILDLTVNDATFAINHKDNEEVEKFLEHLYNQVLICVDSNLNQQEISEKISAYFKAKNDGSLIAVLNRSTNASIAGIINDITQANQLTIAFPVIFFIVALLIVLTTIAQLILREKTQIGTMKALGVKNWQIVFYYSLLMSVVAIIGTILGCILGPAIIPLILNIKYTILYTIPPITYTFPWIVSLIVFAIIIILVSSLTYLLIRKELKCSTAESMRASTPNLKLKNGKNAIKNTSLMMTFRNIRVHLAKSIMAIIGVMGCTALLICGMGIDDTINYGKNLEIQKFSGSDLTIGLNGGVDVGKAKEEIENIEGVNYAEEYTISQATVTSNNVSINTAIYYVSINSKFFGYDDEFTNGHWEIDKVAITEQKAQKLGVKEGDTISFAVNGIQRKFVIDKIYYAFSSNGVFIYREAAPEFNKIPTNVWVDLKNDYDPLLVKDEILSKCKSVYSCMSYQENMDRINGYMTSISQMTNTIKIFAILLAVVVLINLAILNFNERRRDIATLRVLGFSRFEISSSLVYEVMILTLVGALLGIGLGMPMEMLVLGINQVELIDWKYIIYPITYVVSLLISIITTLIANLIISSRVNKISMSESLKSVE